MKTTMVIPTYWARKSQDGWKKGDAVYDHPTPLDKEGTLKRVLKSVGILEDKEFEVIVIATTTSEEIEAQAEKKVKKIIKSVSSEADVNILFIGPKKIKQIQNLLLQEGKKELKDLIQLQGYSNIRNLCILSAHILGSEAAVLIDDDEVFEDPEFMTKAKEFIGKRIGEKRADGIAGYYVQPDGEYHVNKPFSPWMKFWDQNKMMNDTFDILIDTEPRLKETPLVFGGNMIIHKDLFTKVPFDPNVPRGEDIDYLINARMFGFTFFIDNQLSIKHIPAEKTHPTWKRLREDIYRFKYEREKIESQREIEGMTRVSSKDFDPYPGCFLKKNLEEKIEKSSKLLAKEYSEDGDNDGRKESLENMILSKREALPQQDAFLNLVKIQKKWKELMDYTKNLDLEFIVRK